MIACCQVVNKEFVAFLNDNIPRRICISTKNHRKKCFIRKLLALQIEMVDPNRS